MRLWQWWRKNRQIDETETLPTADKEAAKEALQEAEQRWREVNIVADRLAKHQRANHFGDLVNEAMRRKPST